MVCTDGFLVFRFQYGAVGDLVNRRGEGAALGTYSSESSISSEAIRISSRPWTIIGAAAEHTGQ